MAIVNSAAINGVENMIPKVEMRKRIARIIAATRFPFIDQTTWGDLKTVVNDEPRFGVEGLDGVVYPSIAILRPDGGLQEVGEVEMEDSVTEVQVPKWRLLSEKTGMGRKVKKLYIYVPEGLEDVAKRLLEENGIEYAGLRTWAIREGQLALTPIVTPDGMVDHRPT